VKNFALGVAVTLVVLGLGGLLYLRLGFAEVRADLPPSRFESAVMHSAMHASVRQRAPKIPNPVPATDENLIAGGKFYLEGCAGCHGAPGKPDESSDSLYPRIPQLPVVGTELTEAQIFWVTKHGIRYSGMFANGKFHSDEKMWTMAAYIKRIKNLPEKVKEELAKPAEKK
jgi:mono/diheme cytochrome c family protein